jgi:ribosomal protein S18 acetylase RimI-like enzyme
MEALEDRARGRGMRGIYLAVLAANPRGWAFWEKQGFRHTGKSGLDRDTGHQLHRLGKAL